MRPAASALCAAALIASCEPNGDRGSSAVARDSAGIRIVESARPLWGDGDAWRVGEQSLAIGAALGMDPGQELDRVVGATRLADGSIIIADAGARALLRFDSTGRLIQSMGRAGEGPGEFLAPSWLGQLRGDSLVVWDRGLGRVSVFTRGGAVGREYRPTLTESPVSLVVKGHLTDGSLLLARGAGLVSREGGPGVQRQPVSAWLISPAGEALRSFGPFPGETFHLDATSRSFTPLPLGGKTIVAAAGEAIYVADTEVFAVRVFAPDGALTRIVRREYSRRPARPEEIEAAIDELMSDLPPNLRNRDGWRRRFRELPLPEHVPALRAIHIDAEDHLWLQATPGARDTTGAWSVFDPDGRWLGDVMLPRSLALLEIGPDYILARDEDALGVHRVVLLPLLRAPES